MSNQTKNNFTLFFEDVCKDKTPTKACNRRGCNPVSATIILSNISSYIMIIFC